MTLESRFLCGVTATPTQVQSIFDFLIKKMVDHRAAFGNITNADGDRRATNCRREREGIRRKSTQVEKRSGEPAQIAVRYPPRVKGYHPRGQTESRSGRLRGSKRKNRGQPLFFLRPARLNEFRRPTRPINPPARQWRWVCHPLPMTLAQLAPSMRKPTLDSPFILPILSDRVERSIGGGAFP